jgi:NAD(P)H-hydrate repair Nnr-like enzyme with NAD(P)H-hydrate epimerase domain
MRTIRSITMAQRKLTQKEWDQANDLSDELMTVMVGKGTSGGVGVVAVAFLMAKALLSLSDNDKAEAHTKLDNVAIPNITQAIEEFEFRDIIYN